MLIGFVVLILNCLPNGQYCDAKPYSVDEGTIHQSEGECLERVKYYNSFFNPQGELICGEVRN